MSIEKIFVECKNCTLNEWEICQIATEDCRIDEDTSLPF